MNTQVKRLISRWSLHMPNMDFRLTQAMRAISRYDLIHTARRIHSHVAHNMMSVMWCQKLCCFSTMGEGTNARVSFDEGRFLFLVALVWSLSPEKPFPLTDTGITSVWRDNISQRERHGLQWNHLILRIKNKLHITLSRCRQLHLNNGNLMSRHGLIITLIFLRT